jgi:Spy/CpxP family protein refolding chaperone
MSARFFFGIALFMSLALNLFLLGGMAPHHHRGNHMNLQPADRMMENAEQLAEPARTEVKKIIESYRPQLDAQMTRVKNSREKLQALLQSDGYTRAKADVQFEAMQKEMSQMQDIAKQMILDVNEKLTPEQRIKMMPPHGDKPHEEVEK